MTSSHSSDKALQRINNIRCAVEAALPGWRCREDPHPFGWARARHFKVALDREGYTHNVFFKQCYSQESYTREKLLYTEVLPFISIRTPQMIETFKLAEEENGWLILEDVGDVCAGSNVSEHRSAFLNVLGFLHGQSKRLVESGQFNNLFQSLHFTSDQKIEEWRLLLKRAIAIPAFALDERIISILHDLPKRIKNEPHVLLHGDTDYSNVMLNEDTIVLLDWEQACISYPCLDLGRATELMQSVDELIAYQHGYCEGWQQALPIEEVRNWYQTGTAYNCIRWVCYYVKAVIEGNAPPDEWREQYYEPCLEKLKEIQ